ncbi:MAG: 50S ribosomal protein L20 [Acidimicrobiales bacterium]
MARVKRAVHSRKHRQAVLEAAQGYYGNKSRSFRAANEQVMHSLQYAYRDRRARKSDFRKLWIQRINAACRLQGVSYSRFMAALRTSGISLDRKVLADLAVRDPSTFASLVHQALGPSSGGQAPPSHPAPSHPGRAAVPASPAADGPSVPAGVAPAVEVEEAAS